MPDTFSSLGEKRVDFHTLEKLSAEIRVKLCLFTPKNLPCQNRNRAGKPKMDSLSFCGSNVFSVTDFMNETFIFVQSVLKIDDISL